ncbi:MAG: hypothetical protein KDD65_07740 [Bacteroidetes bacterium]|nr:hypothetical protein [Bacteroidota bacterium]
MILDHAKWKRSHSSSSKAELPERSMSLTDLEDVFQRAVDNAVGPIDARMARVEKQLRQLSEPSPKLISRAEEESRKLEGPQDS